MDSAHAAALAVIQGVTEFLPISSSGHLILVPELLGWPDQGLSFDIAVHLGTLFAVVVYFRRDLLDMASKLFRFETSESRLAWQIVVATVPLGLAGLLFADYVENELRSPLVIAVTSIVFGVLLWAADYYGRGQKSVAVLSWRGTLALGFAQALALIPGTSRSGVTMTMALSLGLSRRAAGRISFLLAIPAIGMAAVWQLIQFGRNPDAVDWGILLPATSLSALTAFVTIALFLRLIESIGMTAFVLYRFLLAGVIVYVLL